jgi:hypothetical protein
MQLPLGTQERKFAVVLRRMIRFLNAFLAIGHPHGFIFHSEGKQCHLLKDTDCHKR